MQRLRTHELMEGENVKVKRLFPFHRDRLIADPFVLWDDFELPPGSGFPTHAHRGFEAITYLFEGSMNHADNLGNNTTVYAGGIQRFTAGSGISHSETPGKQGVTRGIQLWINLPQSLKHIDAEYQQVDATNIPVFEYKGVTVREIVGENSPVNLRTPVIYKDIRLQQNVQHTEHIPEEHQAVIYVHEGNALINDEMTAPGEAVLITEAGEITIQAELESIVIMAAGHPHRESVRLTGGFVD